MHGILHPAKLQNFDTWQRDRFADYGGSDRKDGLIAPDGTLYLIKYAENHTRKNELDTSYVNNVLSEYLSSHILSIIGYDVHETVLGTRNDEIIVACMNFVPKDQKLIEFGRYLRKRYDSGEICTSRNFSRSARERLENGIPIFFAYTVHVLTKGEAADF